MLRFKGTLEEHVSIIIWANAERVAFPGWDTMMDLVLSSGGLSLPSPPHHVPEDRRR